MANRDNFKIKDQENKKIKRNEIGNNRPTHIKFNLSFFTTNNNFSNKNEGFIDEYKLQLYERMVFLSEKELIQVLSYRKNVGFETINKEDFNRNDIKYNETFDSVEFRRKESNGKYFIFRLYPNCNPIPARIIGKLINNVFYVMFIDLKHEMYDG